MYEQFKLRRLGGQPSLESFIQSSPSLQQRQDFDFVKDGY